VRAALAGLALLLVAAPARADDACAHTIGVTGRAASARAPDFAAVTVGVETKAQSPAAALDAASKAVAGVVALGRELGVPEGDIGTSAVVLEAATRAVTRPNGTVESQPDGYRAANAVTIRLADMGRLGDLLRRALDAGANRIDSIGFGLNDPEKVDAELQVAAARDARARAAELAEAVGAKLGRLCSLSGSGSAVPPPMPMAAQARMKAPAPGRRVPLAAGAIESRSEVQASFAVAQ
jgi:hypothetical protein